MKFSKLFFVSILIAVFAFRSEAQIPKWDVTTKLDEGKIFNVNVTKLDSVDESVSYTDFADFSSIDGQTTIYAGYKFTSAATADADSLRIIYESTPDKINVLPYDTLVVSNKATLTETTLSPSTSHGPFWRLRIETIGTNLKAVRLFLYTYALKRD